MPTATEGGVAEEGCYGEIDIWENYGQELRYGRCKRSLAIIQENRSGEVLRKWEHTCRRSSGQSEHG